MIEGENSGVKVREFAIIVPLALPMPGRVEDKMKSTSFTELTPTIPSLIVIHDQGQVPSAFWHPEILILCNSNRLKFIYHSTYIRKSCLSQTLLLPFLYWFFSSLLFFSVLLATFPQARRSYFRCSDALGRSSGCKNVPSRPSLS